MNPTRKVKKPTSKQVVKKPKPTSKQVVKKPKPIKNEGGGRRRIPLVATQTPTRRTTTASKTAYDDMQMPIPERNLMLRMPNQPSTRRTTTALWRLRKNNIIQHPIPSPNRDNVYKTQYERQLDSAKEEEEKINEILYKVRFDAAIKRLIDEGRIDRPTTAMRKSII